MSNLDAAKMVWISAFGAAWVEVRNYTPAGRWTNQELEDLRRQEARRIADYAVLQYTKLAKEW